MRAICVDDEKLITDYLTALCRDLPPLTGAEGFTRARDALDWLRENDAALALLDIDMPDMNGLALAAEIKRLRPDTAIIFLTGFSEYAVDAFALRVSGYLLKPVSRERLAEEVAYALSGRHAAPKAHIQARTFGSFELLVDGAPAAFRQAKCKELLAYLVDRQGGSVTRAEAFSILWEDRMYDRPMQKQFDAILRSLRDTLAECGAGDILGEVIKWVSGKGADIAIDQLLQVDNHFVYSTGKLMVGDEPKTISLGILGHVFTFGKDDIDQVLRQAMCMPEPAEQPSVGITPPPASEPVEPVEPEVAPDDTLGSVMPRDDAEPYDPAQAMIDSLARKAKKEAVRVAKEWAKKQIDNL